MSCSFATTAGCATERWVRDQRSGWRSEIKVHYQPSLNIARLLDARCVFHWTKYRSCFMLVLCFTNIAYADHFRKSQWCHLIHTTPFPDKLKTKRTLFKSPLVSTHNHCETPIHSQSLAPLSSPPFFRPPSPPLPSPFLLPLPSTGCPPRSCATAGDGRGRAAAAADDLRLYSNYFN